MTDELADIGGMTWGIEDNSKDLAEIWRDQPWRRREFGEREFDNLNRAYSRLGLLLSAIATSQPTLRVVRNAISKH